MSHRYRTRALALATSIAIVGVLAACSGSVESEVSGLPEDSTVVEAGAAGDASRDSASDGGSDAFADALDDGGFDGRTDGGEWCAPPLARCGLECVDPRTDARNCGGCGNACAISNLCANGACQLSCPPGTSACDGTCVVLASDPQNCGACKSACGPDAFCSSGSCQSLVSDAGTCNAPARTCNAVCVDVTIDSANCGACNVVCAADRICKQGECACTGGRMSCSGVCKDVSNDDKNCGACGKTCGTNEACSNGTCQCALGMLSCNGKCSDPRIDATNCGVCGVACGAGKVCTAGQCRSAVGDWSMIGGNAEHTGESTTETAVPPAIARWSRRVRDTGIEGAVQGVAVLGARVFVTTAQVWTGSLRALHASDGVELWTRGFGAWSVGWPSAVDGVVYVQQNKDVGQTYSALWALDATNGATKWSAPFTSQWEQFYSPTVAGDAVFINGGGYGGLYGFELADGTERFFNGTLAQYDEWSPAYSDGKVYSLAGQVFMEHDPLTGAALWSVAAPRAWTGYSMETSPVVHGGKAFLVTPPNVMAVDLATHKVAWTASDAYRATAAVSGSTMFAVGGGTLRALDVATGQVSWTFAGDGALFYTPVIAAGHVYVASKTKVYAVSLVTHASVWEGDAGGWLSIGAGRLFVASDTGVLTAFVLTPAN